MNHEPEVIHESGEIGDHVYRWYGWASPIGLSVFLIALGVVAVLVRMAVVGR